MVAARPWTDDEVKQLRALVAAGGLTAAQIGNEIGRPRNAVIGKALRLGIRLPGAVGPMGTFRVTRPKDPARPKAPRPQPAEKPVQGLSLPKVQTYRGDPEPQRTATPRPGASPFQTCQWYFGDPKAGDMSKCCQPTAGSSSFCEEHHRRVYVPTQPRQLQRRA